MSGISAASDVGSPWPALPADTWKDTLETLQLWTQIVGKIRMVESPAVNHSWSTTLYVTARGLTTSTIPHGSRIFQLDFDFVSHQLQIRTGEGAERSMALTSRTVADFYGELMSTLRDMGLEVSIITKPNEVMDPIHFEKDQKHASYDPAAVLPLHRALLQADRVLKSFRAGFIGKCSPVHFFWGSFDLAVTRFSGRTAPPHPGGVPNLPDRVTREAYSHEVSSAGFWPGGGIADPCFYSYAYPEPAGYKDASAGPVGAYNPDFHEFMLPYESVRAASDPDQTLLHFLQSTYEAAADRAQWDRAALERHLTTG